MPAAEPKPLNERLARLRPLLEPNREHEVSIRNHIANMGVDERIEGPVANGAVRLPLRPYGRKDEQRFSYRCKMLI